jgi:hypothetical protein
MHSEFAWRVLARRGEETYRAYGDEPQQSERAPGELPSGASLRLRCFVAVA